MSCLSKSLSFLNRYPWTICIIGPSTIFIPMLVIGKVIYWGTPALQFIPWQAYGWHLLSEGFWPTWNSLNGLGAPLIANYQLAWYYPPNWILGFFYWIGGAAGIGIGYTFLTFIHFSWAGVGMQQFLSRMKLSIPAQVLGALAFQLSGYLVARTSFFSMIWTAAWMPWILYFVTKVEIPYKERLIDPINNRKNFGLLLLSLAMLLLAGHAQLAWYILLYSFFFSAVWACNKWGCAYLPRFLILFIGIILLAVGVSAVQLLPTGEYLLYSQRSTAYAADQAFIYSFSPWRLIEFVFHGFFGAPQSGNYWGYGSYWEDAIYIGIMPFILALSNIKIKLIQDRGVKIFLWVILVVGIILALGDHTPIFPFLFWHIPTFSMFQAPARYMLWVVFSLSVLAAYGLSEWKVPKNRTKKFISLSIVCAVAVALGAISASVLVPNLDASIIQALLIGSFLLAVSFYFLVKVPDEVNSKKEWWSWAIVLFTLTDLIFANIHGIPSTSSSVFSTSVTRPLALDRTYLSAGDEYQIKFNRLFRFTDSRQIEPLEKTNLFLLPNANLLIREGNITNFDPLLPANYQAWKSYIDKLPEKLQMRWLRFIGTTAVIHYNPSVPSGISFDQIPNSTIAHWLPCGFGVSEDSALHETQRVFSEGLEEKILVVEGAVPAVTCNYSDNGQANILTTSPTSFSIRTDAKSPGWLVIAETWYPGWKVSIDGKAAKLFRADFFLMAVQVPAGKHDVTFWYQPTSTFLGAGLSIIFVVMSIWVVGRISRHEKNHAVQ